jgi:protein TonB
MTTFLEPKKQNRAVRRAAVTAAVLAALVGLGLLFKGLAGESESKRKQVVHQISLLRPPPPPPPPPKEEPKPPEIKKEEVKLEDPKPQEQPQPGDDKPVSEQLGLDAAPGAGGDQFGLASRPGGRDITTIGSDPRSQYGWYAGLIKRHFDEISAKNRKLQGKRYNATVRIWLARDGRITRSELVGSSGDAETDKVLKQMLAEMPPVGEPPPENMPQPLRMRVTSRS